MKLEEIGSQLLEMQDEHQLLNSSPGHQLSHLLDEHIVHTTDNGIKVAGYEVAWYILERIKGSPEPSGKRLQLIKVVQAIGNVIYEERKD